MKQSLTKFITFSVLVFVSGFFGSGCATEQLTPEERVVERAKSEERRRLADARQQAEEEADQQRNAAEQRRDAERELREKYAKYSTAELNLMHARYKELQQSSASGRDLNVRVNARSVNSDAKNVERLLEIERELLRRWNAGDRDAHLPEFDVLPPHRAN